VKTDRSRVTAVRRLLLLAGCLACTLPGPARGWVHLGDSAATSYYMDPETLRVDGQQRRVWRLFEYRESQSNGVQSGKALIEIDCRDRTYRYLRTMYYSGGMGQGKFVGGMGAQRKEYIGPGTMIDSLARTVCAPAAATAAAGK
jgi:hypothetical protein